MRHLCRSLFLAFCLACSPVYALPTFKGMTVLAAMHPKFPCDALLQSLSTARVPAIQVLYGSFGSDVRCLARFTHRFRSRTHVIEMHYSNEAGRRHAGRLTRLDLFPKESVRKYNSRLSHMSEETMLVIASRAIDIAELFSAISTSKTRVIVSTGLEDNYDSRAYKNIYSVIKSKLPSGFELARSPVGHNSIVTAHNSFLETHVVRPTLKGRCIASLDGETGFSLPTFFRFMRHNPCRGVFAWFPHWQGIDGGPFKTPIKRNFVITKSDVSLMRNVLNGN